MDKDEIRVLLDVPIIHGWSLFEVFGRALDKNANHSIDIDRWTPMCNYQQRRKNAHRHWRLCSGILPATVDSETASVVQFAHLCSA